MPLSIPILGTDAHDPVQLRFIKLGAAAVLRTSSGCFKTNPTGTQSTTKLQGSEMWLPWPTRMGASNQQSIRALRTWAKISSAACFHVTV